MDSKNKFLSSPTWELPPEPERLRGRRKLTSFFDDLGEAALALQLEVIKLPEVEDEDKLGYAN